LLTTVLDLQSVVPLNEECGLIEWVPNLVGLRPTIMNLYRERGIAPTNKELKTMICGKLQYDYGEYVKNYFISFLNLFISIKRSVRKEETNVSRKVITTTSSYIWGLVSYYVS